MKKQVVMLAAFCGMALATQAQDMSSGTNGTSGDFKANSGDVTAEANLNLFNGASSNIGLSNGLQQLRLRYFLSDDMAVRLGLGFNRNSSTDSTIVSGISVLAEGATTTWSFSPGIEKHFSGTERISPYVGAEIVLTGQSSSTTYTGKDANGEVSGMDADGTRDRSSFGINAVTGVDWYITRRLYLGFEVGLGFSSSKEKDSEETFTSTSGGTSTTTTVKTTGIAKSGSFGPNVNNSLRIGFAF